MPPRRGPNADMMDFLKLKPKEFSGSIDPKIVEHWVDEMDKIFALMQCTEVQKVRFATHMLTGEAGQWWKMTKRITPVIDGPDATWEMFLDLFNKKYFPACVRAEKQKEFVDLEQGEMTVAEYEAKFTELSRYYPELVANEFQRAKKFERGLKGIIRVRLTPLMLETYASVVERALLIERDIKEYDKIKESKKKVKTEIENKSKNIVPYTKKRMATEAPKRVTPISSVSSGSACGYCGKKHGTAPCYKQSGACFNCGKIGQDRKSVV